VEGADKASACYRDLEGALAYLYERVATLGPFDGLCCYSQGANMGAIIAAAASKGLIPGQSAFKFAIMFCGSEWGWAAQAITSHGRKDLFPIPTPAIVVQGTDDPLGDVASHRRYAELWDGRFRVELRHDSGHVPFGADIGDTHQLAQACRELVEACKVEVDEQRESAGAALRDDIGSSVGKKVRLTRQGTQGVLSVVRKSVGAKGSPSKEVQTSSRDCSKELSMSMRAESLRPSSPSSPSLAC